MVTEFLPTLKYYLPEGWQTLTLPEDLSANADPEAASNSQSRSVSSDHQDRGDRKDDKRDQGRESADMRNHDRDFALPSSPRQFPRRAAMAAVAKG